LSPEKSKDEKATGEMLFSARGTSRKEKTRAAYTLAIGPKKSQKYGTDVCQVTCFVPVVAGQSSRHDLTLGFPPVEKVAEELVD
jgi:hypothetical protein